MIAPVQTANGQHQRRQSVGTEARDKWGRDMSELIGQELCGEPCDAIGCFELGIMYSGGREVEVDLIQAHKWFNIAAARGHCDGAQMRREIAALMSDSEIGQAQRAARDWLRANPLASLPPQVPVEIRVAA